MIVGSNLNILLSIVFLIMSFVITVYSYFKKNPALLVSGLFFFIYMGIRPLLLATDNYFEYAFMNNLESKVNSNILFKSLIYQIAALILFFIGYFSKLGFPSIGIKRDIKLDLYSTLFLCIIAFLLCLFTPFFFGYTLLLLVLGFHLHEIVNKSTIIKFLNLYIALIFTLSTLIFFSDNRRDYLAFMLLFFIVYIFKNKYGFFRFFLTGIVLSVLMIYIAVAFRTDGLFSPHIVFERLYNNDVVWRVLEIETDFSIVYDDFTLFFSDSYNYPFLYGESFLKPLISVFPRSFFPEKLEPLSSLYSYYFAPEKYWQGSSQPTTLFGDSYWNFGYFGVFVFFVSGAILRNFDLAFKKAMITNCDKFTSSYCLCIAVTLFHVLRGPSDTFWMYHAGVTFWYLFLMSFLRFKFRIN